jgi:hypothetical protein
MAVDGHPQRLDRLVVLDRDCVGLVRADLKNHRDGRGTSLGPRDQQSTHWDRYDEDDRKSHYQQHPKDQQISGIWAARALLAEIEKTRLLVNHGPILFGTRPRQGSPLKVPLSVSGRLEVQLQGAKKVVTVIDGG